LPIFKREALADTSQKKRSYLLDPLEISTTFIYFAIITIVVVIIIIIISHGWERERESRMFDYNSLFFLVYYLLFLIFGILYQWDSCPCLKPLSEKTKRSLPLICPCSWKAEYIFWIVLSIKTYLWFYQIQIVWLQLFIYFPHEFHEVQ
jgi:hypothetical protein